MGKQANLKKLKRHLGEMVKAKVLRPSDVNDYYRLAKGRTAPAPGPWPMEVRELVDFQGGASKVNVPVPRHRVWIGDYAK
jgi:hypothetical protein